MKKIIAVIMACFLINSFVLTDIVSAAVMPVPLKTSGFSSVAGKITDCFLPAGGNPDVIFIQDLHSSVSVQKNIAKIIAAFSDNYNIGRILVEGAPFERLDTVLIKNIGRLGLSDALLKDGMLSGVEYYVSSSGSRNINLFGLEQWDIYLNNIIRASKIMKDNLYMSELYKSFRDMLYAKIPGVKNILKYVDFDDDSIIADMNQPIVQYADFQKYWQLADVAEQINFKKLNRELIAFTKELQNSISTEEYTGILNFANKKEYEEYYNILHKKLSQRKNGEKDYKNLYLFLNYTKAKNSINLFNLINQKDEYLSDFMNSFEIDDQTKEYMFAVKMTKLLKSFNDLTITEQDYRFFEQNYEKYINLISKILAEDFLQYDDLFFNIDIFDYHNANIERNSIFVKNITGSVNTDNSSVNIVVAGGFHSSILSQLKEKNIGYVLITPSVENDINNSVYNDMMQTASDSDFDSQALAKIPMMLAADASLKIPRKIREKYFCAIIEEIAKTDSSPEAVKQAVETAVEDTSSVSKISSDKIPVIPSVEDDKFILTVGSDKLVFDIKDGKVAWNNETNTVLEHSDVSDKGDGKFIEFIKKSFNIFEATSMKLNPDSKYSSRIMSVRTGKRKNISFTLAMIFSLLHKYKYAYDVMTGWFTRSIRDSLEEYTVDFDGKPVKVCVEKELLKYISKEDIEDIFAQAKSRVAKDYSYDKDMIVIGLLSKSTNLFEDHLNNGFIGVNEGVLNFQDEDVKKAIIKVGIIHEFSHEIKGNLDDESDYKNFEDYMMFNDIKDLVEYIAYAEKGEHIALSDISYDYYDRIVKRIVTVMTAPFYESDGKTPVSLMNPNVRFIRKLINYKYDIKDIISFLKRKDFTDDDRRGQLKHLESVFLANDKQKRKEIFSGLTDDEDSEKMIPMEEFLEKNIPERKKDIEKRISDMVANLRDILSASSIERENPELVNKICNEFYDCINDGLRMMYKRMPKYMFLKFCNEQTVIPDHALNHSIEVLNQAIKILGRDSDIKARFEKLDIRALVYAALMHDISCILFRIDHEENSAIWAESILRGSLSEERVKKITTICRGHKKPKNGPREEHKIFEAALLCDADAFSAIFDLERIIGIWVSAREDIFRPSLTTEDRLKLIRENKFMLADGGDALNDLMRQFSRRNPDIYLTEGAREIVAISRNTRFLVDFLDSQKIRTLLKNANMGISDDTVDKMIETMQPVLKELFPDSYSTKTNTLINYDENAFTFEAKTALLKKYVGLFFKYIKKVFERTVLKKDSVIRESFQPITVFSDIHGGYGRLTELIASLLDSTIDTSSMTAEDLENIVMDRLNSAEDDSMFYILGDMLDRGDKTVKSFRFIKKMFETNKARYVMGNHDIYAFMNLLGLHLPYYPGYKGISDSYSVILNKENAETEIINIKELLEKKRVEYAGKVNDKNHWAKKLSEYMQYADEQQKKWSEKEAGLQEAFFNTFGVRLDKDGKDILNNPSGIFAGDEELLRFHKKFFGRNVGIAVYTGIRAVSKMSVNWWIDRKSELTSLKKKYPGYMDYWTKLESEINTILYEQNKKAAEEYYKFNNWEWLVIDSIMYRNYESTEWNALDWSYHNKWGGGKDGFISQRDREVEISERERLKDKIAEIEAEEGADKAEAWFQQHRKKVTNYKYLEDSVFADLRDFFKNNFYLYRTDRYGIYYMHSLLPVDDSGDVSIGFVDENGVFQEYDKDGKRIKGFIYKGQHYKGKNIFKGLARISEDIRNFDTGSGNLSEIHEALTLITAVYADNTTRVKPVNMKEMRDKFGYDKILRKLGVTTVVVGHNPVSKLEAAFEYTTFASLFNKENKMINVVQIDGSMSPGYAKPKGAGLVRVIGGGIRTRGFTTGTDTQITSNVVPDVDFRTFVFSTVVNIFPFIKNILDAETKILAKIRALRDTRNEKIISKTNTLVMGLAENRDELKKFDVLTGAGVTCMPLVLSKEPVSEFIERKIIDTFKFTLPDGRVTDVFLTVNKMKLSKKYMNVLSVDFDKSAGITQSDIVQAVMAHISDRLESDSSSSDYRILNRYSNVVFADSKYRTDFEKISKKINSKISDALENSFGVLPVLFDIRKKKDTDALENVTKQMSIEKIQNILAAA